MILFEKIKSTKSKFVSGTATAMLFCLFCLLFAFADAAGADSVGNFIRAKTKNNSSVSSSSASQQAQQQNEPAQPEEELPNFTENYDELNKSHEVFLNPAEAVIYAAYAKPNKPSNASKPDMTPKPAANELRGVWVSYIDWKKLPADEASFRSAANAMMARIKACGMNAVFVHAHSHSDSYYKKSSFFPPTLFYAGMNGGFDPFQIMIEAARANGLQIHAWFNPYRVTGDIATWDKIPYTSIVKQWQGNILTRRNVLKHGDAYYLNPAKKEVADYLVAAIKEFLTNYDVDGLQFDDYFYPQIDDSVPHRSFDRAEYPAGAGKTPAQWRRDNVSELIRTVHAAVKQTRPNALFGISPQANIATLKRDDRMFVDIEKWMSGSEYIDYVMPQIYWGFEARGSNGKTASYSYTNCLYDWIRLKEKGPVKLGVGLALYRAGTNTKDGNSVSEWKRRSDIIARQVTAARGTGKVFGFGFFAYSDLTRSSAAREIENLKSVLK